MRRKARKVQHYTCTQSYLSERNQAVRVAEAVSDPRELQWGVPQGFVLFTTLPQHMLSCAVMEFMSDHEYVDDTQGDIGWSMREVVD